ncbi:MAG: hypothetical protein ACRENC_11855 [Gemmatimonadaceae bacterium]
MAAVRPLSPAQMTAAKILADGWSYRQAAQLMGVTYGTFVGHVNDAAFRIPGDLPPRLRVIAWWRGATAAVLGVWRHEAVTRSTTLSEATTIYGGRCCPHCGNIVPHGTESTERGDVRPA